jgi:hypothetical protein
VPGKSFKYLLLYLDISEEERPVSDDEAPISAQDTLPEGKAGEGGSANTDSREVNFYV